MNGRRSLYIQAIRGPVLLASIGVLFAIHQAGVLSFARTWPLLVIVIGVMKLLERTWAPVQPFAGGYPNAGYARPANFARQPGTPGISQSPRSSQPTPDLPPRTPGGTSL